MPMIALETDGPSLMLVGEVTFMNAGLSGVASGDASALAAGGGCVASGAGGKEAGASDCEVALRWSFGRGLRRRRRGWSLRLCQSLSRRLRWSFGWGWRRSLLHRYRVRRIRRRRGHDVKAARFFGGLSFVDSLYARRGRHKGLPKGCAFADGLGHVVRREVDRSRYRRDRRPPLSPRARAGRISYSD